MQGTLALAVMVIDPKAIFRCGFSKYRVRHGRMEWAPLEGGDWNISGMSVRDLAQGSWELECPGPEVTDAQIADHFEALSKAADADTTAGHGQREGAALAFQKCAAILRARVLFR